MISRRRVTGGVPGFWIKVGVLTSPPAVAALLGLVLGPACVRDPLPRVCPTIEAGALVITEIRGSQTGADTYGQWIEIYNASDADIDLVGLSLRGIKTDGAGDFEFLVRDPDVTLGPGEYAVLAGVGAGGHDFAAYDFSDEEGRSFYSSGILSLYSCDALVDRVLYRGLPATGTLALDGAVTPDAAANDDSADPIWCVDQTPAQPGEPMTELGLRGTPGESNRPCL